MKNKKRVRRPNAKKNYIQNKAAMVCISFVVCMLLAVLVFQGYSLKQDIKENNARIAELQETYASEEARTEEIEALQEYMQSKEYIEKFAKEKIGLVKDNEIVFKENK